ncbi:MAG TPA: pyridoxal phosphate-dependent aminotransferase [Candidatus Eremiobacteraeota bacterium]|nr:MAG: Aspartate aminotransferase [bacterium ADurb.Bin363]HPZ09262.1 pyridoxal phosphate-dependent aminotransferase [Candidatus Eremiobacteraeota bacterium]
MKSERAKKISPSATLEITSRAKKMKKEGKDVVILAAGEPDFPTPRRIKDAAIKAIENNFTTYTPTSGIPELKEAICKKFERDNGLKYTTKEVMAHCGGKHALYLAFQCLLNPKDEVILHIPYWNSYIEQVKLAEGLPVEIMSKPDMSLDMDQIKSSITDKTKVLLINSPSNPSGYVIKKEEALVIGEILLKNKDLFLISDEVYEYFIYEGKHINIASLFPELKERILIVNAVSKSYSMTGWRLGYCAGPEELISSMTSLQDHMTSNPSSISQIAAVEAISGEQEDVKIMLQEFTKRRSFLVDTLNRFPLISCSPPGGAFYAFVNIEKTGMNSVTFADKLLSESLVAVIPGKAFGMDNYIRLSFAASREALEKGVERIEKFLKTV